jgi:hypothetical protein
MHFYGAEHRRPPARRKRKACFAVNTKQNITTWKYDMPKIAACKRDKRDGLQG